VGSLGALRWTSRAGLPYTFTPEPVLQSAAPEQAEALRQALHDQRHPDPEPLIRANQKLADAIARNRAGVEAEIASWRRETWTETIDRPDHDGQHHDRDIAVDTLHDPYADLLPPSPEGERVTRRLGDRAGPPAGARSSAHSPDSSC
jgi:hypothetical protein